MRFWKRMMSDHMKSRLEMPIFVMQDTGLMFGMHPSAVYFGLGITRWLYERYFRVISKAQRYSRWRTSDSAANHSEYLNRWNDAVARCSQEYWSSPGSSRYCWPFCSSVAVYRYACPRWYGWARGSECLIRSGWIVWDFSQKVFLVLLNL